MCSGEVLGPRNCTLFLYIILLRCAVFDKKLRKKSKKMCGFGACRWCFGEAVSWAAGSASGINGDVLGRRCLGQPAGVRVCTTMCWREVQGKSEKRKVCGPAGKWGVAGAGWLVCWGCRETVGKTELCAPAEGVADKTGANGG